MGVLDNWPADKTGEESPGSSSSEGGEGWADENDDGEMTSGTDDVDSWGSSTVDTFFFLDLVEEHHDRKLLLLPFKFIKHLLERMQGFRYHTCNLNATFHRGRVWWQKYHLNIFILDADGLRMARHTVCYQ